MLLERTPREEARADCPCRRSPDARPGAGALDVGLGDLPGPPGIPRLERELHQHLRGAEVPRRLRVRLDERELLPGHLCGAREVSPEHGEVGLVGEPVARTLPLVEVGPGLLERHAHARLGAAEREHRVGHQVVARLVEGIAVDVAPGVVLARFAVSGRRVDGLQPEEAIDRRRDVQAPLERLARLAHAPEPRQHATRALPRVAVLCD